MATISTSKHPPIPTNGGAVFAADGLSVHVPVSAFTLDGFRTWVTSEALPEKLRVAYLDGEVYLDMSKEEQETHAAVKAEISWVVMGLYRHTGRGKFYFDGVLVTNEDAELSTNPDATFISRESLEAGRARLVPKENRPGAYLEIEGSPDWILEVVSESSVKKDLRLLRVAYHRAHVSEYWLVDARGDELVFQILYWCKAGVAAAPSKDGWQRSRVFGRSFRLERRRDDLGLWEYTLHVKPA
jgi:Uma2 family endonuclease